MATKSYTKAAPADLYQEITDRVLALIDQGVKPWECPWVKSGGGIPVNSTGAHYHGVNVPLLWIEQQEKGYSAHQWMTFKQAQDLGGHVRKGEKGSRIFFYKTLEVDDRSGLCDSSGNPVKAKVPMLRAYTVFNVEQIDGLPEKYQPAAPADLPGGFDPIQTGEDVISAFGIPVSIGGERACYSPLSDSVRLPDRERFADALNFYATALHELAHATGHKGRLNREQDGGYGTSSYGFEELGAELGAAMASAQLGLQGELEGHASYIENWGKLLRHDKKAFSKAASQAQKADDWIIDRYHAAQANPARMAA